MLGIKDVGVYIPETRIDNYGRKKQFSIDDNFIEQKTGIKKVAQMAADENTADICIKAYENLLERSAVNASEIEALIVVTQNPDYQIPHTSALVHGRLGLPANCACFDISLGCSGFVYALSVIQAFMVVNGFTKGLLITADPYSKVVNQEDKGTALLFGDAAAATYITTDPVFVPGLFTFGTRGEDYNNLIVKEKYLYMNGRAVFNFAAKTVPPDILTMLEKNGLSLEEIDKYLLHQGSKVIVEKIASKLGVHLSKVPFSIGDYGNSCASTIPILLQDEFADASVKNIVISGFGVGLSWASGVLKRQL
ncbi:ketoacyl-ACP synthase III [Deltaproteobacteria bacterium IMCC39524]|nr:ketoacyl-ACP synthase III [Deltaproteobacteria bacterium IMCC39524]